MIVIRIMITRLSNNKKQWVRVERVSWREGVCQLIYGQVHVILLRRGCVDFKIKRAIPFSTNIAFKASKLPCFIVFILPDKRGKWIDKMMQKIDKRNLCQY